jgi:alanyl-tRNA synthetase
LEQLVPAVVQRFGDAFPELKARQNLIQEVIRDEERAFSSLLVRGVKYFNEVADELQQSRRTTVPGDRAFYLYDTLGFPVDLTQIMAAEKGLQVDLEGFQQAMAAQKQRSRDALAAAKLAGRAALRLDTDQIAQLAAKGVSPTDDSFKYSPQLVRSNVRAIFTHDGFVDSW